MDLVRAKPGPGDRGEVDDWRGGGGCLSNVAAHFGLRCRKRGTVSPPPVTNAKRMFRRGIASKDISQYGREEAMYQLAVQFIDEGKRQLVLPLLKRATADDDFPEAASVLNQLKMKSDFVPCRCKRFIDKQLRIRKNHQVSFRRRAFDCEAYADWWHGQP